MEGNDFKKSKGTGGKSMIFLPPFGQLAYHHLKVDKTLGNNF